MRGLKEEKLAAIGSVAGDSQLLLLTETWQDADSPVLNIPGFKSAALPRPTRHRNALRASGGVAAYWSTKISCHVQEWKRSADGSRLWLRLKQQIGFSRDVYLCLVYIAPESSTTRGGVCDDFTQLTAEVAEAAEQGFVLLAGDFNSRTAQLADCTGPDELQHYLAELPHSHLPPLCTTLRTNSDRGDATPFGKQLIAMCQQSDLSILNGRTPGDMQGSLTCYPYTGGSSTVDYYIASHELLWHTAPHLQVLPQDPVSDHCALRLRLTTQPPHAPAPPQLAPQQPPCFKIHPARYEAYQHRLQCQDIQQQLAIAAAPATPLQASAEMLHAAMLQAAKSGFDMQPASRTASQPRTSRFPANPWYDEECKSLRRQLRDARVLDHTSDVSKQLAREYDRVTRRKKRRYVRDQGAAMVQLAKQDSRRFWKKFRGRRADDSFVHDSASLSNHYETLLNVQVSGSSSQTAMPADNPFRRPAHDPNSLNTDFTLAEVKAGIRKLKTGKAADILGIKADLLLAAVEPLAPTVTALFNKIFDSKGDFPQCMAAGIIVSIFKSGDDQDPANYRGITLGSILGKLYAALLDRRLSSWTELHDLRARGQAGFRTDHRTVDNVFILRTLVDQAKATINVKKRKLYTCFVDFSKAFNTIPRGLLGIGLSSWA